MNTNVANFAKSLVRIEKKLSEIKNKYKKIALYGCGSTTKLLAPFFDDRLVIIADKNSPNIKTSYPTCSPEDLKLYEFDCILITLIGREETIINDLISNFSIDQSKIITLIEPIITYDEAFKDISSLSNLPSGICTQEQLESETYQKWINYFKENPLQQHRKLWEFAFISETLKVRNMLLDGKKGLGFAVGTEPLASAFCDFGVEVVATDLDFENAIEQGWVNSNQHANNLKALNKRQLCDDNKFNKLCTFQNVDMNHIPNSLKDFDFIWSACALEHVGSIELGEKFIYDSLKCLKPGGIAVHTTEYNFSSNDETIETGATVLFRKKDIQRIVDNLKKEGHEVEDINFDGGTLPLDKYIDIPPYCQNKHLKLYFANYIITSIGIIIKKKN